MIHLLFALLSFAQLAQGAFTNTTSSDGCLPPDVTTRSIWSILGSCGLTLLICVWHTIHFDIPQDKGYYLSFWFIDSYLSPFWFKVLCGLGSFFAPEMLVMFASRGWWEAREKVIQFREKEYKWSMKHSFFAEMGGFVYWNEDGSLDTIDSLQFLELCKANKIANPIITVKEIKDKSKSDALGKAIYALQLFWFMLQVVVRGSRGFAVTLIELDTVCMAVLSLFVIFLWWDKPLRPESPHIFYYSPPGVELCPRSQSTLSNAWKSEPRFLNRLAACLTRKKQLATDDEEAALVGPDEKSIHSTSRCVDKIGIHFPEVLCLFTWMILGGLHLVAWNFDFPTETEKIMWRVTSSILAGTPVLACFSWCCIEPFFGKQYEDISSALSIILGVISRVLLAGLMLASLRALPYSAHQTVSWTLYIPHL